MTGDVAQVAQLSVGGPGEQHIMFALCHAVDHHLLAVEFELVGLLVEIGPGGGAASAYFEGKV